MATVITIPKENYSLSNVTLDDKIYQIAFKYNKLAEFWTYDLFLDDGTEVAYGVKILPNFICIPTHKAEDFPMGIFYCTSKVDTIAQDSFEKGDARLIFISSLDDILSIKKEAEADGLET